MANSKYGRLFTEQDVKRIAAFAALEGAPSVAAVIAELDAHPEHGTFTFPADEPLFLLRGQDLAAHGGAWSYAYEASRVGASIEFVTSALGAANDLRDWAEQHRDRTKVPD